MKKNLLFLIVVFAVSIFSSCEDEIDSNYGNYPVSWLPVTDWEGENLKPIYTEGETVLINLRFKNFDGNEVERISLFKNRVNSTGEAQDKELIREYSTSDFEYLPEELQYQVKMSFDIETGVYTDQRLQLSATLHTRGNTEQQRSIANFTVAEYFEYIIEGVNYYYMYNNTYTDASIDYTIDHSAAYTALTNVMNHYGFDPENANFQGDLDGNIAAHTPDWVASWYLYFDVGSPAYNVPDLHRAYRLEASWYGGPKRLRSTELGTYQQIDQAIENGQLVIIHGNFRGDFDFKHQMIVVASSEQSFLMLDPAGEWNQQVNGQYTHSADAGNYVKYSKEAVYQAIGESGSVWMHIAVDIEDQDLELAD